jgi:hypothetical protein
VNFYDVLMTDVVLIPVEQLDLPKQPQEHRVEYILVQASVEDGAQILTLQVTATAGL